VKPTNFLQYQDKQKDHDDECNILDHFNDEHGVSSLVSEDDVAITKGLLELTNTHETLRMESRFKGNHITIHNSIIESDQEVLITISDVLVVQAT
jgi:hypothetical protein